MLGLFPLRRFSLFFSFSSSTPSFCDDVVDDDNIEKRVPVNSIDKAESVDLGVVQVLLVSFVLDTLLSVFSRLKLSSSISAMRAIISLFDAFKHIDIRGEIAEADSKLFSSAMMVLDVLRCFRFS